MVLFNPRSITTRLLGSATLWILLPLLLSGWLISAYLKAPIIETLDRQIEDDLARLIDYTKFDADGDIKPFTKYYEDGKFNRINSGWYWQIVSVKDNRIVGRSWSMKGFEIPINKVPQNNKPELLQGLGPVDSDLKVIVRKSKPTGGGADYLFIMAADPAFVFDAVERVNNRLLWAYVIIAVGLFVGLILQVKFGLRPLQKLKTAVIDIKEGRRANLSDDYPLEISPLTKEMNNLLKETSEVLARARSEVGNLAHALKTPISVIANENRRPTPERETIVQTELDKIERHINSYLARDKGHLSTSLTAETTKIQPVAMSLSNALKKQYYDKGLTIDVDIPDTVFFRGTRNDLEEMLGNLMDNASKYCTAMVTVSAKIDPNPGLTGSSVNIVIEDDGPGIPVAIRDALFERGRRADETVTGSGLGLSIVRQISVLYGGNVTLEKSSQDGLRAILKLPSTSKE